MHSHQTLGRGLCRFVVAFALVAGFVTASYAQGWQRIGPRAFNRMCPRHTGGDREYGGNGPEVDVAVTLKRSFDLTRMELEVYMHQIESKSNWTECEYERTFTLATAPLGGRFTYIWAPTSRGWRWQWLGRGQIYDTVNWNYIDTDHTPDNFVPWQWWLSSITVNGDTSGTDVGNCTADDAYITVSFPRFWVWYR